MGKKMQKETRRLRTEDQKTEIREDIALLLVCEDRTENSERRQEQKKRVAVCQPKRAKGTCRIQRKRETKKKKKNEQTRNMSLPLPPAALGFVCRSKL